jgi:hypothetical protein
MHPDTTPTTDLRLWVCTDHAGHYPVGVASIVLAPTEERARELLSAKLREHGLDPEAGPYTLEERRLVECAYVLNDGDY